MCINPYRIYSCIYICIYVYIWIYKDVYIPQYSKLVATMKTPIPGLRVIPLFNHGGGGGPFQNLKTKVQYRGCIPYCIFHIFHAADS